MSAAQREGRLGVGVVGGGKVGPIIALALAGAGHAITGMSTVNAANRERIETMLPGVPILEISEVVRRSELVVFAIPGEELAQLITGLTELGAWQPGQLVMHTAAQHGHSVFAPAMSLGVIPLALHPAMVFTGTSLDLARLTGATIAVTAPAPVLPIGQALAVEMGGEPVVVADADRPAYADAIAAATELSRAVVRQAGDAMASLGVHRPDRVIGGVVRASIEEELRAIAGAADDVETTG